MRLSNFFSSLQFQDHLVINKDVSKILPNRFSIIKNLDGYLLLNRVSTFCQFLGQGIFIYFLKKAITKYIVNVIERVDDVRGYLFIKHKGSK